MSSYFIRRGVTVIKDRELAMLLCGICSLPTLTASHVSHLWLAVGLIGLVAEAHQSFSANLNAKVSDMLLKKGVGSVTGLGGMARSVSWMLFSKSAGYILEWTGSYISLFLFAAPTYLIKSHIFFDKQGKADSFLMFL